MLSCIGHVQLFATPTGSSVHEILQAWILEWVVMPSSRASSWLRDWTPVSASPALQAGSLASGEALTTYIISLILLFDPLQKSSSAPIHHHLFPAHTKDSRPWTLWLLFLHPSLLSFSNSTEASLPEFSLAESFAWKTLKGSFLWDWALSLWDS